MEAVARTSALVLEGSQRRSDTWSRPQTGTVCFGPRMAGEAVGGRRRGSEAVGQAGLAGAGEMLMGRQRRRERQVPGLQPCGPAAEDRGQGGQTWLKVVRGLFRGVAKYLHSHAHTQGRGKQLED